MQDWEDSSPARPRHLVPLWPFWPHFVVAFHYLIAFGSDFWATSLFLLTLQVCWPRLKSISNLNAQSKISHKYKLLVHSTYSYSMNQGSWIKIKQGIMLACLCFFLFQNNVTKYSKQWVGVENNTFIVKRHYKTPKSVNNIAFPFGKSKNVFGNI